MTMSTRLLDFAVAVVFFTGCVSAGLTIGPTDRATLALAAGLADAGIFPLYVSVLEPILADAGGRTVVPRDMDSEEVSESSFRWYPPSNSELVEFTPSVASPLNPRRITSISVKKDCATATVCRDFLETMLGSFQFMERIELPPTDDVEVYFDVAARHSDANCRVWIRQYLADGLWHARIRIWKP